MAIKIRHHKGAFVCNTCGKRCGNKNGDEIYDIGFVLNNYTQIISLCNGCMHELLTKLIKLGCDKWWSFQIHTGQTSYV